MLGIFEAPAMTIAGSGLPPGFGKESPEMEEYSWLTPVAEMANSDNLNTAETIIESVDFARSVVRGEFVGAFFSAADLVQNFLDASAGDTPEESVLPEDEETAGYNQTM